MSNVPQPLQPAATPATTTVTPGSETAADAYRRAVQAKPTGFAENPIGAMASAMDRIGRAAGTALAPGRPVADPDGIRSAEQRFVSAGEAVRANPASLEAKQQQLRAGLELLRDMHKLAPNDPRRVKLAAFVVNLASQLGPDGIPFNLPGLDVRGLLALAARISSRFGDAQAMQHAFGLEQILRTSLTGTSVDAMQLRDALIARFKLTPTAAASLTHNWAARIARAGEMPHVDVSARTMVLTTQQENPNLAVLAKAFWQDHSLHNAAEKQGLADAFQKIANQSSFAVLNRRYKEVRRMAAQELARTRQMESVGGMGASGLVTAAPVARDDSADMFAAVATFSHSDQAARLPDGLTSSLSRFFTS